MLNNKKITTVYIDKDILNKAKSIGLNISKFIELKLKEFIEINSHELTEKPLISIKSHWRDLNPRPTDYESIALPAELQWQYYLLIIVSYTSS